MFCRTAINIQNTLKVQNEPLEDETRRSTARRLGEQHKVSRSTIQRDSQLVDAIHILTENLGEDMSHY